MWNEEEYLQRALNAAIELGDELIANGTVQDYEMVIVNDASTDATPQLADAAAAANPRVKQQIFSMRPPDHTPLK